MTTKLYNQTYDISHKLTQNNNTKAMINDLQNKLQNKNNNLSQNLTE